MAEGGRGGGGGGGGGRVGWLAQHPRSAVCARARAHVRAHVRVCTRACACACVRERVHARMCVFRGTVLLEQVLLV